VILLFQGREIRFHHLLDHLLERDGWRPTEFRLRFRRVADEQVHVGGSQIGLIHVGVALPFQIHTPKRGLAQIADGMSASGRDDEIIRLVLLQHQPHRAHVVRRPTPIAFRVQVAQWQFVREPERDLGGVIGHFVRRKFQAAPRRFVIEQNARDREQVVRLAIVTVIQCPYTLATPYGLRG